MLAFDSCAEGERLVSSGYSRVDTMTVLYSKGELDRGGARVEESSSAERWTRAYLRAFYGGDDLAEVVGPIVASLQGSRAVTLLEARVGLETAGVLAIHRTPGVAGVYCVGTAPEHRREGVATGLLAVAKAAASAEGRAMILQTLDSDGALSFYLKRGFEKMYSKGVLERKLK